MSINNVNIWHVVSLMGPVVGSGDDDAVWAEYRSVNVDDHRQVLDFVRKEILPYYDRFYPEDQAAIKLSFRYYLTRLDVSWGELWWGMLLALNYPKDVRQFFLWVYEGVFGAESYCLENLGRYAESYDPNPIKR